LKRVLKLSMPLAEADVRASVHACKGEQRVRSAIVKQIFSAVQEALPSRKPLAIRYSLFAIRRRFGFNWRGVLPHDRNLNKFGCSEEQPSSLIPARPKFFGTAEPCPPEKTICYSPLAIRYSLPFYQSLIAIRRRFGSAGASPSHFSRPSSHASRSVV
jgi:hypothetical protein